MDKIKPFGFIRHKDFIVEKIKLAIKENKEYKANLYSVLFLDVIITIVYFFFYKILGDLIFGIVNWEFKDYMMFWLAIMIPSKSRFIFSLLRFKESILTGKLNTYLTKPIKSFIFSTFEIASGASVISTSLMVIVYAIVVYLFNYEYILYGTLVLILGTISYLTMINFFLSFLFFAKGADIFFNIFHREIIFLNEKFTPKMFEQSFFANFFYLLPSALYGYFVIEVLKGNFNLFLFYLPYFILTIVVMLISTYFMWKSGLKKYEAFG